MLLYVSCFYDFQEPCIPHQSLTRQQRRSRNLNFETETCLKPRDFFKTFETRKFADYAEIFLQIFKKVLSPLRNWNFANFRRFSHLLMLFLTSRYNRQKVHWIKEVSLSHIVAEFKVSRQYVWDRPKVQHFRSLTFCCKILQLNVVWSWQFKHG